MSVFCDVKEIESERYSLEITSYLILDRTVSTCCVVSILEERRGPIGPNVDVVQPRWANPA